MTPEKMRAVRRIGATGAFGLLVFVIAFYLSFPFERVRDQIIALCAERNIDLEVGSVGPTFGVGMAFGDIRLKTRPTDGGKPTQLQIDKAKVTLSPLAQLGGETAINVSVAALGGQTDVDWQSSKARGEVHIRAEDIAMANLPGVKEVINLPLGGVLGLSVDVTTPNNRTSESAGSVNWKCAACSIGDGREKLKIAGNPLLSEGISLPKMRLGDFVGRIAIEKGVGRFQGVQAKSPDGEILIEGEIRLADPLINSYLDMYVRFRLSDALLKSADKIQLMLQLAESMGKRPDGYYGFRLSGPLGNLSGFQWAKASPFATAASQTAGTRPTSAKLGGAPRPTPGRPTAQPAADPVPPPPAAPEAPREVANDLPKMEVDPLKDPSANLPNFATQPSSDLTPPPPAPSGSPDAMIIR